MAQKVKAVIELLEANGWRCVRTRGSHRVFTKEGAKRPIVVPNKLSNDLPIGTLKSILREAGLE